MKNKHKLVLVLFDDNYNMGQIDIELKEERFDFDFAYCVDLNNDNMIMIDLANEVWTFGDVTHSPVYKKCVAVGKDIWNMG